MNLKRIITGVLSAAMIASCFSGCGSSSNGDTGKNAGEEKETAVNITEATFNETADDAEAETENTETRTVIDHTGAEVTLPKEMHRIVISSILPLPSVYCLFRGSAEDIIGIHPSSMAAAKNSYLINVFPELADADTSFVENGEVNVEQLLTLDPDVVFYSAANTEERALYDNAGIPAVGFSTTLAEYDCVETYASWIQLFGEIYGESDTANEIIADGRKTAEEIKAVTDKIPADERPDVLILFSYDDGVIKAGGSDFFAKYWIETAGGNNVAAALKGSAEVNMEQIYEWDPDIILITNFSSHLPEDLINNTVEGNDWSNVKAVREGKVYKFPLGMYRWFPPASDTPLVLKWLAKTIQPELFKDMDMDEEMRDFYSEHYGVQLTDEDIQKIYHPARAASGKKS